MDHEIAAIRRSPNFETPVVQSYLAFPLLVEKDGATIPFKIMVGSQQRAIVLQNEFELRGQIRRQLKKFFEDQPIAPVRGSLKGLFLEFHAVPEGKNVGPIDAQILTAPEGPKNIFIAKDACLLHLNSVQNGKYSSCTVPWNKEKITSSVEKKFEVVLGSETFEFTFSLNEREWTLKSSTFVPGTAFVFALIRLPELIDLN